MKEIFRGAGFGFGFALGFAGVFVIGGLMAARTAKRDWNEFQSAMFGSPEKPSGS